MPLSPSKSNLSPSIMPSLRREASPLPESSGAKIRRVEETRETIETQSTQCLPSTSSTQFVENILNFNFADSFKTDLTFDSSLDLDQLLDQLLNQTKESSSESSPQTTNEFFLTSKSFINVVHSESEINTSLSTTTYILGLNKLETEVSDDNVMYYKFKIPLKTREFTFPLRKTIKSIKISNRHSEEGVNLIINNARFSRNTNFSSVIIPINDCPLSLGSNTLEVIIISNDPIFSKPEIKQLTNHHVLICTFVLIEKNRDTHNKPR